MPSSLRAALTRGTAPFDGAVLRRYTITAPGFAGAAVLRLPYDGEDLNGNDGARLHLWHFGGDRWVLQPAAARGWTGWGKHMSKAAGSQRFRTGRWRMAAHRQP